MNVIARLEYELVYYDSAVHRFNHYATRTPYSSILVIIQSFVISSFIFIIYIYLLDDNLSILKLTTIGICLMIDLRWLH